MVAGCALKKPPDAAAIKEQALADGADARAVDGAARRRRCADNWLATFRDDQLTAAVAEAIAHNADLRVGATRVEQAQLHAKLAGAKLYPSVDLLARGGGKLSGDGSGIQGGVLTATWELDLWGRVRYGRAASAAQAASAEADFEYARQSIAALVAKSWFLATEAGLQIEAARETIRANEELVRLADDRTRRRGRQSRGCVRRARQRRRPIATSCASSSWDVSRRFERSSSCSAATPRPRRPPRRSCRVSRRGPGGTAIGAAGAATGRGRRRAARGGRVQSDPVRPRRPACRSSR